jgi:hypothetical protein
MQLKKYSEEAMTNDIVLNIEDKKELYKKA